MPRKFNSYKNQAVFFKSNKKIISHNNQVLVMFIFWWY